MKKRLMSLLLAACLLLGMGVSALADGAAGDLAPSDETPVPEVTEELLPPAEEAETEPTPAPETTEEPLPPADGTEAETTPAPETTEEPLPPAEEAETEPTSAPETTGEPLPPADGTEEETAPAPEATEEPLPPAEEETDAPAETVPAPEEAAEPAAAAEEPAMVYVDTYINPLYAGLVSEDDLIRSVPGDTAPAFEPLTGSTPEELGAAVRPLLRARQQTISFSFYLDSYSKPNVITYAINVLAAACGHTGVPDEGDYLRYGYIGYECGWGYLPYDDGSATVSLQLTMTYTSDAAQEAQVTARVAEVLAGLRLEGKNEYEKLKAVYDYICAHVVYDDYHVEMGEKYPAQFSAYAALIQGTSVCQGYACLLYRMALEADVDCRIISGQGNGGNHAWNIARIGRLYYDLDSTWDAPRYAYGYYDYFLRCHANFDDHVPDPEYTSAAWNAAYPMSTTDYQEGSEPPAAGTVPGTDLGWAVHGNTLTIDGGGAVPDLSTGAPWSYYATQLHSIVLSAGVDSVAPGAFSACTALESVRVENPHCQILPLFPNTFANADIAGYRYSSAHNYADAYDRTFTAIGCLGDVTGGDGETTGADLDALFSAVKSAGTLDRTTADVSGDGAVDLKDVTGLYQHLNGARPYFD